MFRTIAAWIFGSLITCVASTIVLVPGIFYRSPKHLARVSNRWARILLWMAGVRLTVENSPIIRDGTVRFFVGNHQSSLDIFILLAASQGYVRFLAKKSLFRIPFMGWVLSMYGHVPIDRSNNRRTYESIGRMLESSRKAPVNLVVFAEGTRSREGQLLPFRKGAMTICRRAGLGIVPFSIDGSGAVLGANRYRVRPGPVRLRFAEPIPADEAEAMSSEQLHDRIRDAVVRGLSGEPAVSSKTGADHRPLTEPNQTHGLIGNSAAHP